MADASRPPRAYRPNSEVDDARSDDIDGQAFHHVPVMVGEVVDLLGSVPAGVILDATVGGAGHSHSILASWDHLTTVGIDRDPAALAAAGRRLQGFKERAVLSRARFDQLGDVLDRLGVDRLAGFLFDLGVSSPQLDWADRGFSYRNDGPLDMRMDPDGPRTAADFVNSATHGEIARALKSYGDERFAGRIATAILKNRPFSSTTTLAETVVDAIPAAARRTGGHPAKRTFQALRIEINDELTVLGPALDAALDRLLPGGRGLVLTYHSGEDRIVKGVFRARTHQEVPPGLPVNPEPTGFVLLRPQAAKPGNAELQANPRSKSARLRGVERTSIETRAA